MDELCGRLKMEVEDVRNGGEFVALKKTWWRGGIGVIAGGYVECWCCLGRD
jgi:hypothetical protein